ncbi:peptide deformylase [Phlyctochytrium arcticum]|nr:peptide deformylase [Phlyctochytrium arcticum]
MSGFARITGWLKRPPSVLRAGHPSLRITAEPVKLNELGSQRLNRVINDMRAVFGSPYVPVIGLAAPQVGHPLRIIAYRVEDDKLLKEHRMQPVPLTFLINPELVILNKDKASMADSKHWSSEYESCESVPNYNALVRRAKKVQIDAFDLKGEKVAFKAEGLLARILQHEVDHLNGTLYTDHMDCKSLRHDKYIDKYEVYKGR